jgi:cob(I)alamin adenosyltransferase
MAIYTKKGDKGETSLYVGKRVLKDSLVINAIGAIDELNSYFGVVISVSEDPQPKKILKDIQKDLLTIGSILSGSDLRFFKNRTTKLEKMIDELEGKLPPLKHFIIPGGTRVAAHLQYARSLVRRAERAVVALSKEEKVKPQIFTYLNRLSDLVFMLAREVNYKMGVKEETWIGKKGK